MNAQGSDSEDITSEQAQKFVVQALLTAGKQAGLKVGSRCLFALCRHLAS
jgi:hypothetical protein